MPTFCIVVPCYNEASRLDRQAFLSFAEEHPEVFLLFVNDGSQDATRQVLQSMSAECRQVEHLDLPANVGKAEAVRQGFLKALTGKYDWIGYLDADLATPLSEWWRLARITRENHWETGFASRVLLLGSQIRRLWLRHYLGRIFATVVSLMTRIAVYDTQCGAKVFSAGVAGELFENPFISPWFFDVEILYRIKKKGTGLEKTGEIPLQIWIERKGSRLKIRDFLRVPVELWRMWKVYH
jgi:glycosyltransferase involved in cell wall biosynthesis